MSPQLRGTPLSSRAQQRGAIGLMAALTLGLVLLFMLLVVDSGRLYMEQRKLQRVADMAALEAVSRGGTCLGNSPTAASYANQSATRNAFAPSTTQTVSTTCGTLVTGSDKLRTFSADINKAEAIRVITTTVVPTSVAGGVWNLYSGAGVGLNTKLTASAVGATPWPTLAQLSIRSTLVTVDTAKALLLNNLFSQLLGGNVVISAGGWEGLAKADINLLQYLNQLAIDLNLKAGDYTQLLNANATIKQLIQAAATVAKINNPTADISTTLTDLKLAALKNPGLKVGDLLQLQTGTSSAGLDTNVQLFQLLQVFLQIANKDNFLTSSIPLNLPGLASITTQIKIIEPPQFSAIGDPAKAKANPLGPNKIYVRTAQIRTLITVNLSKLSLISGLLNAVNDLLSPITNLVTGLLCGLGLCSESVDIVLLPPPLSISVNLDTGGASTYLVDYNCSPNNKSLTARSQSSIANINVGKITDPSSVFSSTNLVSMTPVPLVDIGTRCFLCQRKPFGGGGIALSVNSYIAQHDAQDLLFANTTAPTNIKQKPTEMSLKPSSDIVASLKKTLSGVSIQLYGPVDNTGILNSVITTTVAAVNTALNAVLGILLPLVVNILSGLLDPLINNFLSLLGIDLMDTQVGANLSCNQGGRAQLVL